MINLERVPAGFRLRVGEKWYDCINFAQDSIGHVNAKRPQEVYALWGLVVSAFGLFIVALDKIVTFIRWLFPNFPNL